MAMRYLAKVESVGSSPIILFYAALSHWLIACLPSRFKGVRFSHAALEQ